MAEIEIKNSDGKSETVYGTYNEETRTITTGSDKIHLGGNDRVTVKGGCFIATEVYGGINKPQVVILRKYRDKVIIPQGYIGRTFVKSYYRVGPYLASFIRKVPILKPIIRKGLDKIAYKCSKAI